MARPVEIRPLARSELEAVTTGLPGQPFAPVNKHEERLDIQEANGAAYLIAWAESHPVGHVLVRFAPASVEARLLGCAELEDLEVAEPARRRGVGTALLAAAEAAASEAGAHTLGFAVTVVNPWNAAARRLYERAGYRSAGLDDFVTGYSYWDEDGREHRDEELHRYLAKVLPDRE